MSNDPKAPFNQANGYAATCSACANWTQHVKNTPYDMLLCKAPRNAPGLVQPYWTACELFVQRHNKPELTDAPAKTQTSKETQNG